MDDENEELEDGIPLIDKEDDDLFLGVDDDVIGGGEDEPDEDDELDAFGMHVEEEEPDF